MSKYSNELKINACKEYLEGKLSHKEICLKYGIYYNEKRRNSEIFSWLHKYRVDGENAFISKSGYNSYTSEFKAEVVESYLSGDGSLEDVAAKYKIPSSETVRRWVLSYNANGTLVDYNPKPEVYMANARRKTTIEERKEIVEYCLAHNRNYKDTAILYDVSYSQVYSWVKKYDATGEEGLSDKRGHRKTDDELDELERLRRENKRLKRQLEENDMMVQLLKKVKEFEGM